MLCGVCPGWALTGVADPPGRLAPAILDDPVADSTGVRIGAAFAGDAGARPDGAASTRDCTTSSPWPRPVARHRARRATRRSCASTGARWCCGRAPRGIVGDWSLEGATAYVERNWGNGFPPVWWWGEAHDFGGDPVTVAFAGGPALGPLRATAVVVHVGGRLVRLGEPRDRRRARRRRARPLGAARPLAAAPGRDRGRGRPGAEHVLDVPVPAERRTVPWSHQHLAGRLRVRVTRRGRLVYAGESELAGLELGRAPAS